MKRRIHKDTYKNPVFVIVPTDVPENDLMEQLYMEDGRKYQIDGDDVRLVLRTKKTILEGSLIYPIEIDNYMRGNWAYDSISFKGEYLERIEELLSMTKSYKK